MFFCHDLFSGSSKSEELDSITYYHRKALLLARTNPDSAFVYKDKARQRIPNDSYSWLLATNLSVEARILMLSRQDADAFLKYLQALDMYQALDTLDYFNQYSIQRNLASISKRNGLTEAAIDFYVESSDSAEKSIQLYPDESYKLGLDNAISRMTYFEALCFDELGKLDEAARILIGLLESPIVQKDLALKSDVFIELGLIYKDISQFEEASNYFERVLNLRETSGYRWSKAMHALALVSFLQNDYPNAKLQFVQSIKKLQSLSSSTAIRKKLFASHLDLGEVYFTEGNYEKSILLWEQALEIGAGLEGDPGLYIIYDWLLRAYLETGNTIMAKKARAQYMAFNSRYLDNRARLTEAINANLFSNQIVRFEESKIKEAELEVIRARNIQNLLIALIVFIALMPAIIYTYRRYKRRGLFKGLIDIVRS